MPCSYECSPCAARGRHANELSRLAANLLHTTCTALCSAAATDALTHVASCWLPLLLPTGHRSPVPQRAAVQAAARLPVRCSRSVRALAVADATAQKRWESQARAAALASRCTFQASCHSIHPVPPTTHAHCVSLLSAASSRRRHSICRPPHLLLPLFSFSPPHLALCLR